MNDDEWIANSYIILYNNPATMKWITCIFIIVFSLSVVNGFVHLRLIPQTQPNHLIFERRLVNNFVYKHTLTTTIGKRQQQQSRSILYAAPDGLHWFVKTEQFCKPFPEVKPHLEAHREWVRKLRESNTQTIVSGYRVDENDRPGGGGLMLFAAKDYESAEKLVKNDPLVANECVDWQLNKWIAETGDISIE